MAGRGSDGKWPAPGSGETSPLGEFPKNLDDVENIIEPPNEEGDPVDNSDTGDDDEQGGESPEPDVIPIAGDSTSVQDQIYADPGLGDRGDPPVQPPDPPVQPPDPPLERPDPRDPANATFAPFGPKAEDLGSTGGQVQGRPAWLIPAAVAGVVLLGAIGFAATRGGAEPSSAPAFTLPPAPTFSQPARPTVAPTAGAAPQVTSTRIDEQGNVCLNATTLTFTIKVTGAKAGDAVHLALTGPGLPSDMNGTPLDASGSSSTVIGTVGPVKGNQSWSAAVDRIAGTPVINGPSSVNGRCPAN